MLLELQVQLQHKIKQEAEQFRQWKVSREKELLQVPLTATVNTALIIAVTMASFKRVFSSVLKTIVDYVFYYLFLHAISGNSTAEEGGEKK